MRLFKTPILIRLSRIAAGVSLVVVAYGAYQQRTVIHDLRGEVNFLRMEREKSTARGVVTRQRISDLEDCVERGCTTVAPTTTTTTTLRRRTPATTRRSTTSQVSTPPSTRPVAPTTPTTDCPTLVVRDKCVYFPLH